jgi:hypothetical protein
VLRSASFYRLKITPKSTIIAQAMRRMGIKPHFPVTA